jgi:hypothetical protein
MRQTLIALALAAVAALSSPAAAPARQPADVFSGKVLMSPRPFPTRWASEAQMVAAIKRQSRERFEQAKDGGWRIYYAAFFDRPAPSTEYTLKVFDKTAGSRQVMSFLQVLPSANETQVFSVLGIKPSDMRPNSKFSIQIFERTHEVATGRGVLAGAAPPATGGKVDFGGPGGSGKGGGSGHSSLHRHGARLR